MRTADPLLWLGCAAVVMVGGCKRPGNEYVPPPPPEVTVARPVVSTVPVVLEFTGTTRAFERVELRARVRGFIQAKHVDGGQRVKRGDLLFTIDPREYQAEVKRREAEVAEREAALRLSSLTLGRTTEVFAQGAATQQEVDQAKAMVDSDRAKTDLALATLEAAKLDLEFTEVRSPIDGRLGVLTPEVGQFVGANDATLLAVVVNDSHVYATYTMDEQSLMTQRRTHEGKRPGEDGRPNLVTRLGLQDEEGFPHEGTFVRADAGVDSSTGTITLESLFPNPDGMLLPGQYVRIQITVDETEAALVPDIAVGTDQGGRYVLVVNSENTVERRAVRVGPAADRMRRVDEGLTGDEWVVVNGMQRARPGSAVTPIREGSPSVPVGSTPSTPGG